MFNQLPEVARPDWMQLAVHDVSNTLTVLQRGIVPEVLHGKFLLTSAMRLLRVVYGSDEQTVEALQQFVAHKRGEEEAMNTEIERRVATGLTRIEALDQMCREVAEECTQKGGGK